MRTAKSLSLLLLVMLLAVPAGGQKKRIISSDEKVDRQICITFDDLPVARIDDRIERLMITDEILGTLDEFNVKAAGFVVGDNIKNDFDILESWLAAGHLLGNHTHSHPDLNEVPFALYLHNVEKCQDILDTLLREFGQSEKYFRYPYLHYGKVPQAKERVAEYLEKNRYIIAHVSIDTDDFAYNLQFEKIYDAADSVEYVRFGGEYIDHIMGRVKMAEQLSREILGRQIKHILLLHANRLNSNFLADLLNELQLKGYRFIGLEDALADPVYSLQESYVGSKGLSFLERLSKTDPDLLPARE